MHSYRKELLTEAGAFDGFIAFKFVQLLTKPFSKWPAFELGLIDETGKTLKKAKTSEEKKAFGLFERLVKNMKKLMMKFPGGSSKIASYAAALFLLKEQYNLDEPTVNKMMNCIIENIEEQGMTPVYPDDTLMTMALVEGRYELMSGDVIFIQEAIKPEFNFLGVDIFKSTVTSKGEPILFAFEEIREQF